MSSDAITGQFITARLFQLRGFIAGNFLNEGVEYAVKVFDIHDIIALGGKPFDSDQENTWLFKPAYTFRGGKGDFIVSVRGHISKLNSDDPNDIVGWIQSDVGFQAKLSKHDDIIAYPKSTSQELINQVLAMCNSAALPK